MPVKIYIAESSEKEDKFACIVALKPYKNKLRVMSTGMKGNITQLVIDRVKKTVGCLLISAQNTHAIIFNYRK
jgi:hypothetical protein